MDPKGWSNRARIGFILTYILKYVSNEWRLFFEVLKENGKYTSAKKVSIIMKNFLNLNFCERLLSQRRFPSLARQQQRIDSWQQFNLKFFKREKSLKTFFTLFCFDYKSWLKKHWHKLQDLSVKACFESCFLIHVYVQMSHRN